MRWLVMPLLGLLLCLPLVLEAAEEIGQEDFDETWREVQGDPTVGEDLAIQWCSRCHVIGAFNKYGGINSTPSFWIMNEKPETYAPKLLTFQQRRPHAALKFDLKNRDVENILTYVRTLKRD